MEKVIAQEPIKAHQEVILLHPLVVHLVPTVLRDLVVYLLAVQNLAVAEVQVRAVLRVEAVVAVAAVGVKDNEIAKTILYYRT